MRPYSLWEIGHGIKLITERIIRTKMEWCALKELLDVEAERINSPAFIGEDPVQFPRRFEKQEDIEAASLLSATIAWGNRKMICRDCDKLMGLMADDPHSFIMEGAWEEIPDELNIHRTFFGRNLKYYLRGLKLAFERYGTIEGVAAKSGAAESELPAWTFVKLLSEVLREANDGKTDSRCLPVNIDTTALKRVNMALRWLVRDDGIVDMGVWKVLRPSQLFIPMDVHVSDVSRQLGLLERKSTDRKAVEQLTGRLREFRPEDPCVYDFALFGIGMGL